jgi:ribosomal protein S18 acetylase RimI-like enzyme
LHTIRKALLEDCPGLARIQVDSYRTAYAGIFPDAYLAQFNYQEQEGDWRDWLISKPKDILLVAVADSDQVIGYALTRVEVDIYPGYAAEILAIHVTHLRQGRGVGKALLKHTVAELQYRGCPSVMLWTLKQNSTRNWYKKLGAKRLGEKSYPIEHRDIVEIAYGWDTLESLLSDQTGKNDKSNITGG